MLKTLRVLREPGSGGWGAGSGMGMEIWKCQWSTDLGLELLVLNPKILYNLTTLALGYSLVEQVVKALNAQSYARAIISGFLGVGSRH